MGVSEDKLRHGVRWLRALAGGFLIELVLIIVSMPFFATGHAELVSIIIAPATLVAATLFGAWAAKGATESYVLHGLLAGAFALLIYGTLILGATLAAPEASNDSSTLSPGYLASHLFKLLGGGLGGYLVRCKRLSDNEAR